MPGDLSKALAKGGRSANPIRYFLRSYRDRIFSNGFQLVGSKPDKSGNKQATWRVIPPQPVASDIPSHRATQYGMNGIVSLNVREKEDISMDRGGINPVYPVNVPPAMTGSSKIAVSKNNQSPAVGAKPANIPKSAEDVVAYIDQNLTEIETPVLHDCLTNWGFSYVTTTCQLQERGWKLDPAARTMTKEVTTA